MSLIPTLLGEREADDLLKHEETIDTDVEHTTVVEYCAPDCPGEAHRTGVPEAAQCFCLRHIHRSAVVTIKQWPASLGGAIGDFH